MRAAVAIVLLGLVACTEGRSFEENLTDAQSEAFELCKAEFDRVFRTDLDLPDPNVETTDTAITFSWDKQIAEETGGPVSCKTDARGSELLEIRAASVPLR